LTNIDGSGILNSNGILRLSNAVIPSTISGTLTGDIIISDVAKLNGGWEIGNDVMDPTHIYGDPLGITSVVRLSLGSSGYPVILHTCTIVIDQIRLGVSSGPVLIIGIDARPVINGTLLWTGSGIITTGKSGSINPKSNAALILGESSQFWLPGGLSVSRIIGANTSIIISSGASLIFNGTANEDAGALRLQTGASLLIEQGGTLQLSPDDGYKASIWFDEYASLNNAGTLLCQSSSMLPSTSIVQCGLYGFASSSYTTWTTSVTYVTGASGTSL
jgi:hypothetical protein